MFIFVNEADSQLVHLDADAFFASVEQAADRRLRRLPVAVGGGHRGIIASASYEARALGIRTAMPTRTALRMCPDLRVVPGNFELYEEFSGNIFELCESITPLVERTSIDEGYLSLAGWRGGTTAGPRVERIRQLNAEVAGWMKITLSTGFATNKLVAQVASKLRKPNGFVVVPRGAEGVFLAGLPLRRLPGIGPKTETVLAGIGIHRIGDLVHAGPDRLRPVLGSGTEGVLERARGIDPTPIRLEQEAAKSYGKQETFAEDMGDFEAVVRILQGMIDAVMPRIREDHKQVRTLSLRIRYTDMEEATHAQSLDEPSDVEDAFYGRVRGMLRHVWRRRVHLRLVGVSFSNVYEGWGQRDLFDRRYEQQRRLAFVADELNTHYGAKHRPALQRACHLLI